MALVDFSNAHIEVVSSSYKPLRNSWLGLRGFGGDPIIRDENNNNIVSNLSQSDHSVSVSHFYIALSGTFTTSGTKLYYGNTADGVLYKISNISFSSGDTFDFRINATISVV